MKRFLIPVFAGLLYTGTLPAQNSPEPAIAGPGPAGALSSPKAPLTWRCGQPYTDPRDGQVYQTVPIINNCWMQQNLNYGTQISQEFTPSSNGIVEKYCFDDLPANCAIYGGLYRFGEAVQYSYGHAPQGACPPGWHIPTDGEYIQMHFYLNVAWYDFGGMVKETGFAHWSGPNTGATNATGFTAFGAGYYEVWGSWFYYSLGNFSAFWLSHNENPQCRTLNYDDDDFGYRSTSQPVGYSVRCVYDLPVNMQKIQNLEIIDTRCYQALDTIQTAGENSIFTMSNAASVSMISGSTIRLLPGTTIQYGKSLQTQINPGGPYCSPPGTMPVNLSSGEDDPARDLFRTFPNPTDDFLVAEPVDGIPFPAVFRIYDRLGNQVLATERGSAAAHRLNIGHLPPGLYLLNIISNGQSTTLKVVKK